MTIGTLVAFTALQGALFRPLMGLLDLGVSLTSSMALFSRVFEYLDLPVDIDDPAEPVRVDAADVRGEVRFEHVGFRYPDGRPPGADRRRRHRARRDDAGAGRRDRLGQEHARLAGGAAQRPDDRAGCRSTASTSGT